MKISWVEPSILAASSIPVSANDIQSLHEQGIRAVLSLTEQPLTTFREITPELLNQLDITYYHLPIPDQHPPQIEEAHKILEFIDSMKSQKRATLVHCHAGIGRTGTILHLYYLAQGLTLEQTRAKVRSRRPQCILLSDEQTEFLEHFLNEPNGNFALPALYVENIKGITADGIIYSNQTSSWEYLEFEICHRNWLISHPEHIETDAPKYIGWKDVSANPPYMEFCAQPKTRLEFRLSPACPEPMSCFFYVQRTIFELGKWATWDRS